MSARPFAVQVFCHRYPGLLIRPGRHKSLLQPWRPFVSSAPRCAAQKQPKPPRQSKITTHQQPTLTPSVGGIGLLAAKIARSKNKELTLFASPSHRAYLFSAYGLSAFCFAYAVYNSNITFADPITELPVWQKSLFGGICVTMSVMGTLFLTRTSRLIRHIRAVRINDQTVIDFQVRRMVPFRKPYHIQVPASKISIARQLVVSQESKERFESDSMHTGSVTGTSPGFFKAPIKALSTGLWRLFISVRQVFTGEDFILLNIEGHKGSFRMDANGWVAADFYALGDPVQVKKALVQRR